MLIGKESIINLKKKKKLKDYSSIIRKYLKLNIVYTIYIIIFIVINCLSMFYQLPNGKVIEISTEQYFEMSDEELEYLIAYNYGDVVENPWFGSILSKHEKIEEIEDIVPDLTNITELEKFIDLDIDLSNEE